MLLSVIVFNDGQSKTRDMKENARYEGKRERGEFIEQDSIQNHSTLEGTFFHTL